MPPAASIQTRMKWRGEDFQHDLVFAHALTGDDPGPGLIELFPGGKTDVPHVLFKAWSRFLAFYRRGRLCPDSRDPCRRTGSRESQDSLFHPGAYGPGRPAGFRGRLPQRDRLPARRHRHRAPSRSAGGATSATGRSSTGPERASTCPSPSSPSTSRTQGGRPPSACSRAPLTPPFTGRDGYPAHGSPGTSAHGESPLSRRVSLRPDRDDRWPACRSKSRSKPSTRSSRSIPRTSGIPAVVIRFRVRNLSSRDRQGHASPARIMNPVGFDGEGEI